MNFSVAQVITMQDELIAIWHMAPDAALSLGDKIGQLIGDQHRANFDLWHTEDEARTPGATDAQIADVKRRIDTTNQKRNDLSEQIDAFLLEVLAEHGLPAENAPLNSESPGLMIDRLSILALKIYHTREESERTDAPNGHVERNVARLMILEDQRADLALCLDALWKETMAGTRRFKLYRQLKMYNDPSLNPAIYTKRV
ncbi:DUF4254 domain-containing protein [Terracidiphilus gabretensis]|uniref:DUF4254 domain-containing protein n=1 Tax=Terracidiphilus gabretensis TaxID=1577687 RepID=UPI001E2E98ED|nr:DUF4254 domain-containing protein [Terracidiphilus gabretensis]